MQVTTKASSNVVISLCLLLTAVATAAENSFRWDWRHAEELSAKLTLRRAEVFASERAAIAAAIAAQLRLDMKDLEISGETELAKVALDTRVKLVDLNSDSTPEVIAQGFGLKAGCGATGNCPFWVFQKMGHGYMLLLRTAAQRFNVEPRRTNGFRDIVVATHSSASESILTIYRYNAGTYRNVACYDAEWFSWEGGTFRKLGEPRITPCRR